MPEKMGSVCAGVRALQRPRPLSSGFAFFQAFAFWGFLAAGPALGYFYSPALERSCCASAAGRGARAVRLSLRHDAQRLLL